MRKLMAAAALACAAFFSLQHAEAEDCTLKRIASLPFAANDNDNVVVEISIAGKPFHFLVDTGGVYTEIDQQAVDALHLKTTPLENGIKIFHVRGADGARYTVAKDVTVGPLHLDSLPVLVTNRSWDGHLDGILAPDFLTRFDLDFDFGARTLNLIEPNHCEGKVVYWASAYAMTEFKSDGAHVLVPVTLDGRNLTALLDTGAPLTSLEDVGAEKAFGIDEDSPGAEKLTDQQPGSAGRFRYHFKSLSMGGVAVANPVVYVYHNAGRDAARQMTDQMIADDPVYGQKFATEQMLLGMSMLHNLHLYICYKERKLYMTGAAAH